MLRAYCDFMSNPFSMAGQSGAPMKLLLWAGLALAVLVAGVCGAQASTLSVQQQKGMLRHGIWEWSLKNCPGAYRNTGYWFALKEVGEFENADEIIRNEGGPDFKDGWNYMDLNASLYGVEATCDYAFEQWPAVLYRE